LCQQTFTQIMPNGIVVSDEKVDRVLPSRSTDAV
jgi:hypothetical protein